MSDLAKPFPIFARKPEGTATVDLGALDDSDFDESPLRKIRLTKAPPDDSEW